MPFSTSGFASPYFFTTGHSSGGVSSRPGQPSSTAVVQIRSISHSHSVAFKHQYANDCLMRPFLTTRMFLQTAKNTKTGEPLPKIAHVAVLLQYEDAPGFFADFHFLDHGAGGDVDDGDIVGWAVGG